MDMVSLILLMSTFHIIFVGGGLTASLKKNMFGHYIIKDSLF